MGSTNNTASSNKRVATHAGSWYDAKGDKLTKQLSGWLDAVPAYPQIATPVRAIIAPHAGYSYSGPTAAHCYKQINPATTKRIFILGPSHHHYTKICECSAHAQYATPIADLKLDTEVIAALRKNPLFGSMSETVDADEHSIEMQLPYLALIMKGQPFTLVPILVGALTTAKEATFGQLLAPYLDDPSTVFVISSDFCHWGDRFRFTYYNPKDGARWQSIEALDRVGMGLISAQDVDGFANYQAEFENTICGRHPIGVLLNMLKHCKTKFNVQMLHYAQSNKVVQPDESSVSYVAAAVCLAVSGGGVGGGSSDSSSAAAAATPAATSSGSGGAAASVTPTKSNAAAAKK